ncbi:hypothetical protein [Paenibacillus mucilaginosus]|uniref:Uncharacterized protein n=2 Tax=Paenibacillus mucilaginosus TaxID=61624 RepID=H6N8T9_9BACL|nr:hypothetical protein [Paenibacillus mucilaginosus]AEI38899.1 hypothetical protein KNP414_00274 [Paenibacillus mucilaginosus KNP414]AFC27213.1 hypothetical protein PM3016_233 [Paenibacillus mucilaginosus 3016]MCG7216527.1 hypothetical protein [Paenibacillus mucilaginosus]WDM27957.1 hypothetical protein KCX80_01350 [Paenibacillus mucilaginosus]WFA16134.1 hypothetical protein ERY13_01340 [Paenibacillus mucilaginosus]
MTEYNESKEAEAEALFGMNPPAGEAAANRNAENDAAGPSAQMSEGFAGSGQHQGSDEDEADEGTDRWFQIMQNAALAGRASFPDQIDYYDPESDEFV